MALITGRQTTESYKALAVVYSLNDDMVIIDILCSETPNNIENKSDMWEMNTSVVKKYKYNVVHSDILMEKALYDLINTVMFKNIASYFHFQIVYKFDLYVFQNINKLEYLFSVWPEIRSSVITFLDRLNSVRNEGKISSPDEYHQFMLECKFPEDWSEKLDYNKIGTLFGAPETKSYDDNLIESLKVLVRGVNSFVLNGQELLNTIAACFRKNEIDHTDIINMKNMLESRITDIEVPTIHVSSCNYDSNLATCLIVALNVIKTGLDVNELIRTKKIVLIAQIPNKFVELNGKFYLPDVICERYKSMGFLILLDPCCNNIVNIYESLGLEPADNFHHGTRFESFFADESFYRT